MAYAKETEVTVEKTRSEIDTLIKKAGGSRFAYMDTGNAAIIGFILAGRQLKFVLPLPDPKERQFTHAKVGRATYETALKKEQSEKRWEQVCRSRWRALWLCLKAKLEAVEVGITTVEIEFLAHVVSDNGRTIGERIVPQLDNLPPGPLLLG